MEFRWRIWTRSSAAGASPQYRAVFALVGGIGVITALSAYTLFGQTGVAWALVFVGVFSLIGPRVAPDTIMRMFHARPIDPSRGADIVRLVQSLSVRAGLKAAPRLYVVPSQTMKMHLRLARRPAILLASRKAFCAA